MFIGLVLAGSLIGAVSSAMALILGHSIWLALVIYPAMTSLSVLLGAALVEVLNRPSDTSDPAEHEEATA